MAVEVSYDQVHSVVGQKVLGPLERERGLLINKCNVYLLGLDSEYFQTISRVVRAALYSGRV